MDSSTMTAATRGDRWELMAVLFEGALARPAAERDDYLRENCSEPAVLSELQALLAAHAPEPGPLERVLAALGPPREGDWRPAAPRLEVGPYELLREIGRGGMGVVYLARRADGVYQRQVALKLARAPVIDETLRARLLAERDILAGLAHPNIATLFDGGVTDDGLPYFTMEYVDGRSIDVYCDAHRLGLRARIRLFLHTCAAVAAAHRALIVHRDLKPTNVLVTAAGEVKLLDFGIAKLLAMDGPANRHDTATDSRFMTPAYASPEQVLGAPVSTATDVYALGLLLYELLCGRRAHRLESRGTAHLEQVVVHTDPLPMSDAVARPVPRAASPTAEAIAHARQSTPARLTRQLRGDLARIAAMALRKDPDQRYATAAHLAEDLERYLDGRPVLARGQSLVYRASRLARRHRVALVAAVIAAAALIGYLTLTVRHAREMELAAARERQEAIRAREVADFVVGLFEASDPNIVQNREAPIAKMIEQGLQRADALSAQPQLQARLLNAIGRVYFNMGRYDAASTIAARALAASRLTGGDQHPDVARDYRLLGLVTGALGKHEDAVGMFRNAIEIHRSGTGGSAIESATDTHHLGYALVQAGRLEEGERHIAESLAARRTLLDPGHEDIAMSLSGLAFVRGRQGRTRESADLYRESLAMQVARLGGQHPEVARGRLNLAAALTTFGAFDEAERELTSAHDVYRAVYGERHPSIATTLSYLGRLESRRGRPDEAIRYITGALEMRRELLGPDHPSTLLSQANLAGLLGRDGRAAEGEARLRDALAQPAKKYDIGMGSSRPLLMRTLANTLMIQGRLTEAEATAREAFALATRQPRGNPLEEASVGATLGRVLLARGQNAEAAELLQRVLDIQRDRLNADDPDLVRTQNDLEEARRRLRATRARP